jgi:hypothetical protein
MQIFRFIPNAYNYPLIIRTLSGQWWPEGVDLGRFMNYLCPKSFGDYPWAHEGNCYLHEPSELELSDFPAFALHLPVISPYAADVLTSSGLISTPVPMTVSGRPFFAVQPALTLLEPNLPQPFVAEDSKGLAMSGGEIFHYYSRTFDVSRITKDFFTIPEFEPYSDLYITERLVDIAKAAGLTGLEYLELVYDNGPLEPRYPTIDRSAIPSFTARRKLESELMEGRCSMLLYDTLATRDAVDSAVCSGYASFEYLQPKYN